MPFRCTKVIRGISNPPMVELTSRMDELSATAPVVLMAMRFVWDCAAKAIRLIIAPIKIILDSVMIKCFFKVTCN